MLELVFLTGARAGQTVQVTKSLLAGRSPDCSLEVPDPNASRQHSRFLFDGTGVTVADNGSSNGTYLNDVRIAAPTKLNPGDVVRLGETRIRFQGKRKSPSSDGDPSSIFSFKDVEGEDLSQSIVLKVGDTALRLQSPEVLSARLQSIIKVSKALVQINRIDKVFDGILETLFEVFPQADRGFLMLGAATEKLEPKAIRQRGKAIADNLHVSNSICRKALDTRTAILFDDQKAQDFDQGMSIVSLRIRSAMVVPLIVNDEVLGLLQIDTPDRDRSFTADDLELAVAVSQQAAIALHNALLLESVEKETTVRKNLERFLPGPLVDQAIAGQFDLGGRTCVGTIMFADIVGFTRMSEAMHPEKVVSTMNGYFSRMLPCIETHSGSVDKFMGDCIMAVWGIPIDKGDSAVNAVQASLAMLNALAGFNSLQHRDGNPVLGLAIGINTGTVVAGNIGAEMRKEYTVLGDTVNTAQRVQSVATRGQLIAAAQSWAELQGNGFGSRLPPFKAKNKAEPLVTYSLRGLRILNNEIMLSVPMRSGAHAVQVVRRLNDKSFVVLHAPEADLTAAPLVSAMVERPGVDYGVPAIETVLPGQGTDGLLVRSQVRLADPTLGGMLDGDPLPCMLEWEAMVRA